MKTFLNLSLLAAVVLLVASGCGPSVEERKTMAAFNDMPELIERGGYVKKLDRFERRDDKVFIVEAEIVDENGVPLGLLRSERVEGFLTTRPRIQWFETPGVREEWKPQPQRRRGGGQGRGQGERRGRPEGDAANRGGAQAQPTENAP